jgi:hypothetical protein
MKENPLRKLEDSDQSIWMDFTRREMISTGGLKKLIEERIYITSIEPVSEERRIVHSQRTH